MTARDETYWCRIGEHLKCGGDCHRLDGPPTDCECYCHESDVGVWP